MLQTADGRKMTAHYQAGPLAYVFGRDTIINLNKPDAMQILGAAGDPWEMGQDGSGIVNYFYDGSGKDWVVVDDVNALAKQGAAIHKEWDERSKLEGEQQDRSGTWAKPVSRNQAPRPNARVNLPKRKRL